jgi:hypothetical protein
MTSLEKDGLVYLGSGLAGAMLARSFGAKLLGIAIGGFGGFTFAAWTLMQKQRQSSL